MSYSDAALLLQLSEVTAERDAAVRRAEQAEARVNDLEKQWGEVQLEPCLPTPDTCHTLKANLIAEKDALRAKLDAAWRKGMTDAAYLCDDSCVCGERILVVRNAKSEFPTEPKPAK